MCGIAGAVGDLGPDPGPLSRMVDALRLRGPDDSDSDPYDDSDSDPDGGTIGGPGED